MDGVRLLLAGMVVFTAILVASITFIVVCLVSNTMLDYIVNAVIVLAGSMLVFLAYAYIAETPALRL